MSAIEMTVNSTKDTGAPGRSLEYTDTLAAAGNGNSILTPDDVHGITITLVTTAQAKVQTCNNSHTEVMVGVGLTWDDWDYGLISATTQTDPFYPVTAFRMVQVGAGSSKMQMRAQ